MIRGLSKKFWITDNREAVLQDVRHERRRRELWLACERRPLTVDAGLQRAARCG
jgi:hypothetical protein